MAQNPLGINQGTSAFINFDLSGTVNTQVVGIGYGTISTIGTLSNILGGTLNNIGTIPGIGSVSGLGTLSGVGVVTSLTNGSVNIPNGTLQALGTLGTVGSVVNLGSVTNLGQIYNAGTVQNGTLTLVTTVTNLSNGTIQNSGTVTGVGVVTSLTQGSINVTAGTIATLGTMGTLGTLQNQGSLTNLGQVYNAGTLQGGTINTGTVSLLPLPGSVLTTSVNIGTTAGTAAIPTTALSNRKALIAYNTGTSTVYIGGTGVSLTTGIPIGTASYTPAFDLGTGALYAIAATPGGTLIALEIS